MRCPVHGTAHEPTDECWRDSIFACAWGDCMRHPARGDDVFRVSPKGSPWIGLCAEHEAGFR